MDLVTIHKVFSLVSAAMQMFATILVLSLVVKFFSLKPTESSKMVFLGLLYFFGSSALFLTGAFWLTGISIQFYMLEGVGAFVGALFIHLVYGFLVVVLYFQTIRSGVASLAALMRTRRVNRSKS